MNVLLPRVRMKGICEICGQGYEKEIPKHLVKRNRTCAKDSCKQERVRRTSAINYAKRQKRKGLKNGGL